MKINKILTILTASIFLSVTLSTISVNAIKSYSPENITTDKFLTIYGNVSRKNPDGTRTGIENVKVDIKGLGSTKTISNGWYKISEKINELKESYDIKLSCGSFEETYTIYKKDIVQTTLYDWALVKNIDLPDNTIIKQKNKISYYPILNRFVGFENTMLKSILLLFSYI
jgi:hypothetical protein